MSLLNEQIDVQSTTSGQPALFAWRGHVYRVRRVIASWTTTPEPSSARLVRVATESDEGHASIVDITQDPHSDSWAVRRLWG
ncbi:hypothetical protein J4H86_17040 [Spiractinospora alimapuensis]|uniref:DUF6504 family protein n=1 Tax=Spiractinospora alimapuensis TaxID=2820884 RepID=UPI001F290343|nr:DUF6504 family protein [Spiractinospora alimapuensis]QVQ50598.1 hypothetical protein J4H86_17040 [Spiractinospora alimapuensis]